MVKKNEEVVVRSNTEIAVSDVPDFLLNDPDASGNLGLEDLKSGDFTMPRLALAQKQSKGIEDIAGLRPGLFYNTLTNEVYGAPITVTPLFVMQQRRLFGPMDEGSPTICFSANGKDGGRISDNCLTCPKSSFSYDEAKQKNLRPECLHFWVYILVVHLPDRKFMPLALSLKGKATKAAMDWNGLMRIRNMAAFTGVYELSSFKDGTGSMEFYNIRIKNQGVIGDKQTYDDAKALFEALRGKIHTMKYDESGLAEPDESDKEEVPF